MSLPFITIGFTPETVQTLQRRGRRAPAIINALSRALGQGLKETESHVKLNYLSGTYNSGSIRDGNPPLAVRSGALRQAVISEQDEKLSGYVGTATGPASAYARMLLGPGETTIKPKHRNWLWIPIADNLNPSGIMRHSPSWALSQRGPRGGRLLRIFESKKGNMVAVLQAKIVRDRQGERMGLTPGATAFRSGGKGKLLFVLKKQVTVKGTDALALGAQDKQPRISDLLAAAVSGVMSDGEGAAS